MHLLFFSREFRLGMALGLYVAKNLNMQGQSYHQKTLNVKCSNLVLEDFFFVCVNSWSQMLNLLISHKLYCQKRKSFHTTYIAAASVSKK